MPQRDSDARGSAQDMGPFGQPGTIWQPLRGRRETRLARPAMLRCAGIMRWALLTPAHMAARPYAGPGTSKSATPGGPRTRMQFGKSGGTAGVRTSRRARVSRPATLPLRTYVYAGRRGVRPDGHGRVDAPRGTPRECARGPRVCRSAWWIYRRGQGSPGPRANPPRRRACG